jgi:hypothetical protein
MALLSSPYHNQAKMWGWHAFEETNTRFVGLWDREGNWFCGFVVLDEGLGDVGLWFQMRLDDEGWEIGSEDERWEAKEVTDEEEKERKKEMNVLGWNE